MFSCLKAEMSDELCALDQPGGRGGSDGCLWGRPELSGCRIFEAGWLSAQDSGGRMPTSHLRGDEQVGARHQPSGHLAHKTSGGAFAVAKPLISVSFCPSDRPVGSRNAWISIPGWW